MTMMRVLLIVVLAIGALYSMRWYTPGVSQTGATDEGGDTLVVILHGFTLSRDDVGGVRDLIAAQPGYENADFIVPDLPFGVFSMTRPEAVLVSLLRAIDAAWEKRANQPGTRPYQRIVLVGHSMGGMFARQLYLLAAGSLEAAPVTPELEKIAQAASVQLTGRRPWFDSVERIVLLAAMNRGWTISHHMSISRAAQMWLGSGLGWLIQRFNDRAPIIFSIRRGSPFITQVRLQWLALKRELEAEGRQIVRTVQLLGNKDDLVSPDDNVDLVTGKDFDYLPVPYSGHLDILQLQPADASGERPERIRKRREVIAMAVTARDFSAVAVQPADHALTEDTDVDEVVFVIHGIRDEGYWTRKIANRIIARAQAQDGCKDESELTPCRRFRAETSSYGYFPMLSFLIPDARQEKVEWLMDRYVEAKARYPEAEFSYVGHSHGTYLLANALQRYPAVRFKHVVFAGSVVHKNYGWTALIEETGQVERVVNFVATHDWVVAFFPKAMQILDIQDLGGAGHDGFIEGKASGPVFQLEDGYVTGAHSAALEEDMWDAIADFILTGEFTRPPAHSIASSQRPTVAAMSRVAPLIWIVIALVLIGILVALFRLPVREWKKTVAIGGYLYFVWFVLTNV